MPFSQFCFLRFNEKFCVYLQVPGVKEVLRRRDVPLQAAEEEEGPQRAQAAPLRLLHILHRGETQSEGGEPQLFYLRRGQGAGQTVGRNGPRSQAKVPIFFFCLVLYSNYRSHCCGAGPFLTGSEVFSPAPAPAPIKKKAFSH